MEPPTVSPTIPYVGHIFGLLQSNFNYYVQLSQKTDLPIFTMTMPGVKIDNSIPHPGNPEAAKSSSLSPIEAKFSHQICGTSEEAHAILMRNVNGDEGDWGLSMESYTAMKSALVPGAGLDQMNRIMMEDVAAATRSLMPTEQSTETLDINLNEWLRDMVTTATTHAVYGPRNPFEDQTIRDAFWDFESDLVAILSGVLTFLTARKGLAGRAKVVAAFEKYFQSNGHEQASTLLRNRYETSSRNGISTQDISRYEVGGAVAILVNTAPAVFWMLLYLYSNPRTLEEVREEIYSAAIKTKGERATTTHTVDITAVKSGCPLLASTLQEVLRLRTVGTSVREVMEDTVLDGQWLLKKGAMIQMPSRIIHTDTEVWGGDVGDFNPRRFLKEAKRSDNGSKKKPSPAAFRAFGGGTTLCPGRHFATNEILATVVMMVVQYDLQPTRGEWVMPTCNKTNVAAVVMGPDTDIRVEVSRRLQSDKESWNFVLNDSDKIFALSAEDKDGE